MSTRRLPTPLGEVTIDHGAQYFTARDPAFQKLVSTWHDLGIAAPWPAAGAETWVGVPGMNAIVKQMARAHDVTWGHQVTGIVRKHRKWQLIGEGGEIGPFDAVVLAIPAEQAAAILSLHDFAMARVALLARSQPCWTGMFVSTSHSVDCRQLSAMRGTLPGPPATTPSPAVQRPRLGWCKPAQRGRAPDLTNRRTNSHSCCWPRCPMRPDLTFRSRWRPHHTAGVMRFRPARAMGPYGTLTSDLACAETGCLVRASSAPGYQAACWQSLSLERKCQFNRTSSGVSVAWHC